MRTLVFGGGAVGLGLGSFLLAAGGHVAFVARAASVAALRARGLRRSGVFGRHAAAPERIEAAASLDGLRPGAFDWVLVTTKSYDSEAAAQALAAWPETAGHDTPLVLCQNGWGNAEIFAARLRPERIWNARVITGFRRIAPNHVEVTVHAEPVRIGSLFGGDPARVAPLCRALCAGGLPAEPSARIAEELWAKLLYNGCLNPACAILGVPYGALGDSPHGRALIRATAEESFAVMQAAGQRTRWPDAAAFLVDFHAALLPPTASHESSTLQDLRAGKRTEIDALNGAVVRLGAIHGVPTPVNRVLVEMVAFLEERAARARGVEPAPPAARRGA